MKRFLLGPNFQQKISLGTPKPIKVEEPAVSVLKIEPTETEGTELKTEKESKSSKKIN
jgi:hypothetical protein